MKRRLPALVAAMLMTGTQPYLLGTAISTATVLIIRQPLSAQSANDEYAQYYLSRSVARRGSGDYQGAISDLSIAIESGGNAIRSQAYMNRGDLKHELGDSHGAISDYTQAMNLGNSGGVVHRRRGVAKAAIGEYRLAIADYNIAVAILSPPRQSSPELVIEVHILRGNAWRAIGANQEACEDYKKAVSYGDQPTSKWLMSDDASWCRNMS
jgi:tetratricopeptide (TPR) repeat protein